MNEATVLTNKDKKLLSRIDRAVRGESRLEPGLDGRDGFCELFAATAPQADAAFERRLEARLMAQVRAETPKTSVLTRLATATRGWFAPAWRRGLTVAATMLLVAAAALTVIGPRRVWAQVQQWLGYVPGVGFVHLGETRVLAAPVAVAREGVTVTVEQVLAQPDKTVVVLSIEGLPREDEVWPEGVEGDAIVEPRLHLPDGRELALETFTFRWGWASLTFPAVPFDVHQLTLELPRLPMLPAGIAPEDWQIPLNLLSGSGELVAAHFPEPYAPPNASDTHQGVTLRALTVAHGPDETAVQLQLQWEDETWESHFIRGFQLPTLVDDLGHVYYEQAGGPESGSLTQSVVVGLQRDKNVVPTPVPSRPTIERTLTFAPVSPSARELTLTMGGFDFQIPAEAAFTVDLGENPQVGDRWPLDLDLVLGGFPVHIGEARLIEEQLGRPEEATSRVILQFDIDPVNRGDDMSLNGVALEGPAPAFRGGSLWNYDPQSGMIRSGLEVEEGRRVPSGEIDVRVTGATALLNATWALTWDIPSGEPQAEPGTAPVVLHPPEATDTRNGLTLQLAEAVLTDRLTGVKVGLVDPPEGIALHSALRWSWPDVSPGPFALTDDRGHDYESTRNVGWLAYNAPDPDLAAFAFEPLQPLAQRLTLKLPAVTVVEPAGAAFDVTVPEGLELTPGTDDRPWAASAAWQVDIPLTVGGYQIRFTEARLEELNGGTLLTLVSEPYRPEAKPRWLAGLEIAAVTAPDGRQADLARASSGAGPEMGDGPAHRAMLTFDVTHPDTLAVQPGRYHVEIDGVRTLIQGPWTLTWPVP